MAKRTMQDLTGERYGRWLVLGFSHKIERNPYWFCRCYCGTKRAICGGNLKNGHSLGCGCTRMANMAASVTKHGATHEGKRPPEYTAWMNIRRRCHSPIASDYSRYGGRGISVCDEWIDDFSRFFFDMGPRPSSRHSIERLDNDAGYSKSNCIWATSQVQANNRRNTIFIVLDGEKISLPDACRKMSVNYNMVKRRRLLGWPQHRWFEPPRHW
jgi:hypothetical protein